MLQQSPALRPFVRPFVALTFITLRTCNNKIARIVTSAIARYRDNVIHVIFPFAVLAAVVAFPFLALELIQNVRVSIGACYKTHSCTTIACVCSSSGFAFGCGTVSSVSSIYFSFTFWASIICSAIGVVACFILWRGIVGLHSCLYTFLARCAKTIVALFIFVIFRNWLQFAAFCAAFRRGIHSILANAISHGVCGQRGTSAASSGATLDHKLIIAWNKVGS